MDTLETILLILLVLNAIALCVLVLLQQGKGADIGAAFGSGAASAVFGGAGSASFLAKLTAWLAIGFFAAVARTRVHARKNAPRALKDLGIPVVTEPATLRGAPAQRPRAVEHDGGTTRLRRQQNAAPGDQLTPPE